LVSGSRCSSLLTYEEMRINLTLQEERK
jgi:hypothetical protein